MSDERLSAEEEKRIQAILKRGEHSSLLLSPRQQWLLLTELTALRAEKEQLANELAVANDGASYMWQKAVDAQILRKAAEQQYKESTALYAAVGMCGTHEASEDVKAECPYCQLEAAEAKLKLATEALVRISVNTWRGYAHDRSIQTLAQLHDKEI